MVEVKLNDLNGLKSLQRFAGLLNCKKIVQVVDADNLYRQVKNRFADLPSCAHRCLSQMAGADIYLSKLWIC